LCLLCHQQLRKCFLMFYWAYWLWKKLWDDFFILIPSLVALAMNTRQPTSNFTGVPGLKALGLSQMGARKSMRPIGTCCVRIPTFYGWAPIRAKRPSRTGIESTSTPSEPKDDLDRRNNRIGAGGEGPPTFRSGDQQCISPPTSWL